MASIIGPVLRGIPITSWPARASALTGVLTPRAMVPQKTPSCAGGANIKILYQFIDRTAALAGDIAECGVWRGKTLISMGIYLHQKGIQKTIWGFDSFSGFDDSVQIDVALGGDHVPVKKTGGFDDTSFELVTAKARAFRLRNVQIRPGFFRDSLAQMPERTYCLVHLDCDIQESYEQCLEYFFPRMVTGGIVLFDEYEDPAWPGAKLAVDTFFAGKPERPQRICIDNFVKWFVQKQ